MRSLEDIERLIAGTRIEPRSEMRGKVLPDALKAQEARHARKTVDVSTGPWKTIVKIRAIRLAAAAGLVLAAILGIRQFGGESVAWAKVVKNVEQAEAIVFRLTTKMTGVPGSEMTVYDSSQYGTRMDVRLEGKKTARFYSPRNEHVTIMVYPEAKTYTRMSFTERQRREMRQREKDPREFVGLFLSSDPTELGRKTVDGVEAEGLEVTGPEVGGGMFESAVGRLWVDVKTELPVRMEIEGLSTGGKICTKIVMDAFRWDERLSAGDFEPNIPSDYILLGETKASDVSEGQMIEGLRFFAGLTGGRYPSSMALLTADQEMREAWQRKHDRPPANEELNRFHSLNAACRFYADLVQEDKDVEYHGHEVTAGDLDAELMRWRIAENEYRVLYGDLRIETVVDNDKLLDMALKTSGARLPPDKRGTVLRMLSLNEKDVIRGLGVWLELLDGRYPDSLEPKVAIKQANPLLAKKYGDRKRASEEEKKEIREKGLDVFFASAFYDKLVRERKDVAYYGDTITVEDSAGLLMRWRLSKDKYRVVFGNLTRKSVTAKELAKLEQPTPQ